MSSKYRKIVKKRFDRTVVKRCTKCEKQIPVACKTCPKCGHQLSASNKLKAMHKAEDVLPLKRRRTVRTKRERPDFFNSLEVEKKFKKRRKRKESVVSTQATSPGPSTGSNSNSGVTNGDTPKKKRGRPKGSIMPKPPVSAAKDDNSNSRTPPEEDLFVHLPQEKTLQYSIILAELNRKMGIQNFNPS